MVTTPKPRLDLILLEHKPLPEGMFSLNVLNPVIETIPEIKGLSKIHAPKRLTGDAKYTYQILMGTSRMFAYLSKNTNPGNFQVRKPLTWQEDVYVRIGQVLGFISDEFVLSEAGIEKVNNYREILGSEPFW